MVWRRSRPFGAGQRRRQRVGVGSVRGFVRDALVVPARHLEPALEEQPCRASRARRRSCRWHPRGGRPADAAARYERSSRDLPPATIRLRRSDSSNPSITASAVSTRMFQTRTDAPAAPRRPTRTAIARHAGSRRRSAAARRRRAPRARAGGHRRARPSRTGRARRRTRHSPSDRPLEDGGLDLRRHHLGVGAVAVENARDALLTASPSGEWARAGRAGNARCARPSSPRPSRARCGRGRPARAP